ncbi:MAG: hypothetical protein GWO20_08980 [Candidatus Korarchaeota archaeon]|nr:hypothetical protein [Candidatus Korarchaeota archaeon]NIU82759.1 hypothetical protein [Candidatus Thorarchaeota archaeon]NIW13253.1 hypothetical protein [Candidatus Thorarchaeota archaeon]NIW51380.1 hypothetical protein [Candidatus Korarchaeota archaeon]
MDRRTKIITGIIIVGILVSASLAYVFYFQPEEEKEIETLIIELPDEPRSLDPAIGFSTGMAGMVRTVVEPMYFYLKNESARVRPWLAKGFPEISADKMTYTINLKEDITFSNGVPYNATAQVYSLYRWCIGWTVTTASSAYMVLNHLRGGPKLMSAVSKGNESNILATTKEFINQDKPFEIVDEFTLRIHLNHPFAPFTTLLSAAYAGAINPWYAWEVTEDWLYPDLTINEDVFGEHLPKMEDEGIMGTGPYKNLRWEKGQYIRVEENENWWGGPTNIEPDYERIIFRIVPNFETRRSDLLTGECDIANYPLDRLKDVIELDSWTENRTVVLKDEYKDKLNVHIDKGAAIYPQGSYQTNKTIEIGDTRFLNPFRFEKVREGVNYLFPYEEYIKEAMDGMVFRAKGVFVPEGMLGYDEIVEQVAIHNQDLTKAKDLLDDFYWSDANSTIYAKYYEGAPRQRNALLMLESALEALDIDDDGETPDIEMDVQKVAYATYYDLWTQKKLQFYAWGWGPDYWDPYNYAGEAFLHASSFYARGGSFNDSMLNEWSEQLASETDPDTRAELCVKLANRTVEKDYFMILVQSAFPYVTRKEVQGYTYNPVYFGCWYPYFYEGEID